MQRVFPIAPPSRETIYLACASLIFPLGLAGLFFLINYSAKNVTFVCHNDSLRIKGSMYARTIPRSAIDLPQAKIIDLGAAPPYRLHRRINGTAVKGYREGWFRLNNRRKALVLRPPICTCRWPRTVTATFCRLPVSGLTTLRDQPLPMLSSVRRGSAASGESAPPMSWLWSNGMRVLIVWRSIRPLSNKWSWDTTPRRDILRACDSARKC